jgi:hypothetical protein
MSVWYHKRNMPKTNRTKATAAPRKNWILRHRVTSTILFIILLALAYAAVSSVKHSYETSKEKSHFQVMGISLDSTVKTIGNPNMSLSTNFCQYSSSFDEISRGDRTCFVDRYFFYQSNAFPVADDVTTSIGNALKSDPKLKSGKTGDLNDSGEGYKQIKHSTYRTDYANIECNANYWQVTKTKLPSWHFSINIPSSGLLVEVNCGGSALAEYFPVKTD